MQAQHPVGCAARGQDAKPDFFEQANLLETRERIEIAKEYGADLFLSIHVNAGFSRKAAGSSVYCLSFKGASSNTARMLAKKENASDFVGGVSLDQQNNDLNAIACIEAGDLLTGVIYERPIVCATFCN